jgi:hypothetical protein
VVGDKSLQKVVFLLDRAAPNEPRGSAESVWALSLGGDRYRLKNSPWYAYGASFDDVVYAPLRGGRPTVEQMVEHGGHFTIRVRVEDKAEGPAIRAQLNQFGCGAESYVDEARDSTLMAVDVPSEIALQRVRAYLTDEREAGRLDYEESAVPID